MVSVCLRSGSAGRRWIHAWARWGERRFRYKRQTELHRPAAEPARQRSQRDSGELLWESWALTDRQTDACTCVCSSRSTIWRRWKAVVWTLIIRRSVRGKWRKTSSNKRWRNSTSLKRSRSRACLTCWRTTYGVVLANIRCTILYPIMQSSEIFKIHRFFNPNYRFRSYSSLWKWTLSPLHCGIQYLSVNWQM